MSRCRTPGLLQEFVKIIAPGVQAFRLVHQYHVFRKEAPYLSQCPASRGVVVDGEGWFLTADMIDLLYHECRGVVCLQPFACLPNHITGEGMIHKLHRAYPEAVFLALDCDASASEVNQANRLKLMMNALTEKKETPDDLSFVRKTMNIRKGTTL